MKKFTRFLALFLVFCIIAPINLYAIDTSSFGINIPSIQNLSPSEQSGPKSSGDTVMEYPIDPKTYKVGPGDTLGVYIIVGDADFSVNHSLFVGADGNVFFPNIGAIYLSGLSLDAAKSKIDSKIKSIYKEKYKLYVLLQQPKKVKVYMSGMTKNPGPISVFDNSRISEVLSSTGGVASGASNRYAYIRRKGVDGKDILIKADLFEAYRSRDVSKDIRIQAGDIIEIPDSQDVLISNLAPNANDDNLLFEGKETYVYVYGEVARSGRFEYVPGRKISDYISYAGGPTARALLGFTTLTRQVDGKPKKYNVDVSDAIYNGNQIKDIEVFGGDVINVPGNFFYVSDFTSFVNTILLGLTLYNTVRR